jgi:hypothetical protein
MNLITLNNQVSRKGALTQNVHWYGIVASTFLRTQYSRTRLEHCCQGLANILGQKKLKHRPQR